MPGRLTFLPQGERSSWNGNFLIGQVGMGEMRVTTFFITLPSRLTWAHTGETLKTAIVDYQYGWMELHDDQEKFVRFTLTLKADLSAIGHPEE
jgi:hypothetical protein